MFQDKNCKFFVARYLRTHVCANSSHIGWPNPNYCITNFSFVVRGPTGLLTPVRIFPCPSSGVTNDTPVARKKDFWRLRQKRSPAVDITINLLVNFHLREFSEFSEDNLYISWVLAQSTIHLAASTSLLPGFNGADSVAPFFVYVLFPFFFFLCIVRVTSRKARKQYCAQTALIMLTILHGIKLHIVV